MKNFSLRTQFAIKAKAEDENSLPAFDMLAYTGGELALFGGRAFVDLQGIEIRHELPIFFNHNPEIPVGHVTEYEIGADGLRVRGVFSGAGIVPEADKIVGLGAQGYPWQASIGAEVVDSEYLKEGKSLEINGARVEGPATIFTKVILHEISVVALGADDQTKTSVAAQAAKEKEGSDMGFEAWVKACGFELADLSDEQKASLEAQYQELESLRAQRDADGPDNQSDAQDETRTIAASRAQDGNSADDAIASIRNEIQALRREQEIRAMCANYPQLAAEAVAGGWSDELIKAKIELEEIKAAGSGFSPIHLGDSDGAHSDDVLEAALLLASGTSADTLQSMHRLAPQKIDAALKLNHGGGIGLIEMVDLHASAHGVRLPRLTARNVGEWLRAAFASTLSLPNLLGNTLNKKVLEAYNYAEAAWKVVAKVGTVSDFKTQTTARLNANMTYEKIAADGQIPHGEVSESAYTIQADRFAKMFSLTEQDIINDDLGAFNDIARQLGLGAALAVNRDFWELVVDTAASSFFSSGNANLNTSTALGYAGLKTAAKALREQQMAIADVDGLSHPLNLQPRYLLVPPALEFQARQLMSSSETRKDPSSSDADESGTQNVLKGLAEVVVSAYLSNSYYSNHSDTTWFLLADPMILPGFQVAFLRGQQTPVVESAKADFNHFGIQFRGHLDYGVGLLDPKAWQKCTA